MLLTSRIHKERIKALLALCTWPLKKKEEGRIRWRKETTLIINELWQVSLWEKHSCSEEFFYSNQPENRIQLKGLRLLFNDKSPDMPIVRLQLSSAANSALPRYQNQHEPALWTRITEIGSLERKSILIPEYLRIWTNEKNTIHAVLYFRISQTRLKHFSSLWCAVNVGNLQIKSCSTWSNWGAMQMSCFWPARWQGPCSWGMLPGWVHGPRSSSVDLCHQESHL